MNAIITNRAQTITARSVIIILCISALLLASIACIGGDPNPGGWQPTEGSPADGANATATYGAEQWHAQLTALATEEP